MGDRRHLDRRNVLAYLLTNIAGSFSFSFFFLFFRARFFNSMVFSSYDGLVAAVSSRVGPTGLSLEAVYFFLCTVFEGSASRSVLGNSKGLV